MKSKCLFFEAPYFPRHSNNLPIYSPVTGFSADSAISFFSRLSIIFICSSFNFIYDSQ